ncbi:unnamed protein product, partial [Ectocarpus sp. 12 AP-2014]
AGTAGTTALQFLGKPPPLTAADMINLAAFEGGGDAGDLSGAAAAAAIPPCSG